MAAPTDRCPQNSDPLKLAREGTSQDQRHLAALDPAHAPVDGRTPAHGMVFAQDYAALLRYFDANDRSAGDWRPFFAADVSARLAVVAVEEVDAYKAGLKSCFDYLGRIENEANAGPLKESLAFLYGNLATLAKQLDLLRQSLPPGLALQSVLRNLVKTQLAPAFKRLIAYHKAGVARELLSTDFQPGPAKILRGPVEGFQTVLAAGLSADWSEGAAWEAYVAGIAEDASVYGDGSASVFRQINHCATHKLFRSIFDQFIKVFARTVHEAKLALDDSLSACDSHEPHYALFLVFLRLLEHAKAEANTLTGRHLDFYYREILRFREKPAEPSRVHLLVELAKHAHGREFKPGELFKAGKDSLGRDVLFANDSRLVANQAKVAALKTVYRHGGEAVAGAGGIHQGRIYASPVANSEDGLGAALASADRSWHPFYRKVYADGTLVAIPMPKADIGFAIASHYLLLAEGERKVSLVFKLKGDLSRFTADHKEAVTCLLTTAKGWLAKTPSQFVRGADDKLSLELTLSGEDPAVTGYASKAHGHGFATELPMLLVKLRHSDAFAYLYPLLQAVELQSIALTVAVKGLKTLAVSNDFGPVDLSKPFLPFGSVPLKGSSLVIGSKEVFQKQLTDVAVNWAWLSPPAPYQTTPALDVGFLAQGQWVDAGFSLALSSGELALMDAKATVNATVLDAPDAGADEYHKTGARHGFVRLSLNDGFGQDAHQAELLKYLRKDPGVADPGKAPSGPSLQSLSMDYTASTHISLDAALTEGDYHTRPARFFHLAPFGQAERHPWLSPTGKVYLLPPFDFLRGGVARESEAELYIGVAGLNPPQDLALLFQVSDGTANPLAVKPRPHIDWSYLSGDEWLGFADNTLRDGSDGLLNSGIVTFAVPASASDRNTLLPSGLFWIRAAVGENSDAVCRLQGVAAQALSASHAEGGASPRFATLAAGTVGQLAQPDAAVKAVTQPFPSFGGRGTEQAAAFRTRVSERLRHKDRAITLWDYERLVLEAFPQIHRVKCLNHTCYEPSDTGQGIYRELAPGHVTVIAIPNVQAQPLRDPLRPYASLGLLEEIAAFLKGRLACFATLHVKNPQFEDLRVSFGLRLREGFDEIHYMNELRQTITRFLSPWAFAGGGEPSFGGKIHKSVLIDFIEEQPYVDYVADFQMFHDIGGVPGNIDLDEAEGSKAISILVSAPAGRHQIRLIPAGAEASPGAACVCAA